MASAALRVRGERRGHGHRRIRHRSSVLAAGALLALCASLVLPTSTPGADAYWTDTAEVEVETQLAPLPEPPGQPGGAAVLACTRSNGLLASSMTYSWEKRSWRGTPLVYSATAHVSNSGKTVAHALAVESSGTRVVLTSGLLGDLLGSLGDLLGGLQLVKTSTVTVVVEARYADGSTWVGSTEGHGEYFTSILGLLGQFTCK